MNSSRYLVARIASSFGLHRKNRRLSEAADEMHLLRQAEEILGEDVWEETEGVEEINVEYWNLRKFQIAVGKLETSIQESDEILEQSHAERNTILNHTNDICQVLEVERDGLIRESEKLIAKRDEIIGRAQQVKRKFEASRTKVMVLTNQDDNDGRDNKSVISEERNKLSDYKTLFSGLKEEREKIGEEIQQFDEKITELETRLTDDRKRLRDEASTAYQSIGKANRDKSKLRAEVGVIENEMKQH